MVHFYWRVATFLFGFLLGIILAICIYGNYQHLDVHLKKQIPTYQAWSTSQILKRKPLLWDILRYGNGGIYKLESNFLFKKIQVLCIIFVRKPKNFNAAKSTWIQNCNNLQSIVIKSKKNKYIALKRTKENSSWVLLCQTLKNITDQYNWYLIVNDNTFTILENLRYFVAPYNSSDNYYFGYPVQFWNTLYNSGQAGYVLSNGALKAVKRDLSENECSTSAYWNREDFYLGMYQNPYLNLVQNFIIFERPFKNIFI